MKIGNIVFAVLSSVLSASAAQDLSLPFGNFGLDEACGEINSANSSLEKDSGIGLFFDYYAVLLTNPSGGASQGTNYTHEMLYGVNIDLEKVLNWKGATFTVSGAYNVGDDLSNKIGNFFTVSESYVNNGAMLYEIYLSQTKDFDFGSVQISIGRISMSDDFASLPIFGYLVSGGIDSTPAAIFSNSPFTSSPVATWGVSAVLSTEGNVSFAAGLYQIPDNINDNWRGVDMGISSDDGYMAVFQAEWSPTFKCGGSELSGEYQLGGYFYGGYNPGSFPGSDRENAYGFYLQGQQQIWKDSADRYVAIWAGVQAAPVQSISIMPWMAYAGIQFQGFVPYRSGDGIYFSWLTGWFSSDYAKTVNYDVSQETVLEFTYVIQLNEYVSIQPDFQYIIRPYGNGSIDNAFVVGGQLLVSF